MNTPFHEGELRAQALAGVSSSGNGIRAFMPDQHRDFFAALPFVLAGTVDADGRPRARVLSGKPGFIDSPDPATLRIAVDDSGMQAGQALGLLGLDFATRRRNRANGMVRSVGAGELLIEVRESFGNCPQHIVLRDVHAVAAVPAVVREFDGLDERAMIARAETFFIATSGGAHGVDISHRGGPMGFVRMEGDTLIVPDFGGNRFFNTLGNLLLDPRAALLFIHDETGAVLELEGRARIVWEQGAAVPGQAGGRHWRFTTERGRISQGGLPLRWRR
ncbi:pyridoxamine 5'-phosphate oxidase [Massilia sp. CCM 8695]|uniref:Pyridoxamine 5'-phosphate oxidase n=1 Tax=Massilia frigida TaxID=2609281 RepID=A0ABX0NG26_9BURK|nr:MULTISPECIES: pyridoxamine 5'-phosphate oxidase family protein [Massilia]MDM5179673.1 pyridoxamine 5'-phosphate oxidase family protein [Massilia sp. DJPM01]NHZ81622.1 pyridoxamine 5'-phosphate oxidase [Massilia frigida]